MALIAFSTAGSSPKQRTLLATALREGSAELHHDVERAGIMRELLRGHITRGGYCALLRNLHALYLSLETHLSRNAAYPALAMFTYPELARCAALASDLHFLDGTRWEQEIPLQTAMVQYVVRLDELARTDPRALVAHAYVRYLGDLSGGQLVRSVIASNLGLANESGLAFYRFSGDTKVLAQRLRAGLDSIALTPEEQLRLVDEVKFAFRLHIELFEQLADGARIASSR